MKTTDCLLTNKYYLPECIFARLDPDTLNYICMAEPENGLRDISVYGCTEHCEHYCLAGDTLSSTEQPKLKLKPKNDPVEHPQHYTNGKFECIDVIFDMLNGYEDPISAWLTGQIVKYIWRWPYKNGLEDLKKTRFYLDRLIEHEEEKNGKS